MSCHKANAKIRLLVLDIDGTVVDASNRIRKSVTTAIRAARRRGVDVAIATGRLYRSSLDAYEGVESNLPLICYEGALIREPISGLVHNHWPVEARIAAQVVDYLQQPNFGRRLSVHFYLNDDLYLWNFNESSRKYLEGSKVEPIVVEDLRHLRGQSPTKVMVVSDRARDLVRVRERLEFSSSRTQVNQTNSVALLEIFHSAASKGRAVRHLAEKIMDLRSENVMAVGDDFNDADMIQYAGIGVAMGNAPTSVKAMADAVAPTVDADGVVDVIETWILRK